MLHEYGKHDSEGADLPIAAHLPLCIHTSHAFCHGPTDPHRLAHWQTDMSHNRGAHLSHTDPHNGLHWESCRHQSRGAGLYYTDQHSCCCQYTAACPSPAAHPSATHPHSSHHCDTHTLQIHACVPLGSCHCRWTLAQRTRSPNHGRRHLPTAATWQRGSQQDCSKQLIVMGSGLVSSSHVHGRAQHMYDACFMLWLHHTADDISAFVRLTLTVIGAPTWCNKSRRKGVTDNGAMRAETWHRTCQGSLTDSFGMRHQ